MDSGGKGSSEELIAKTAGVIYAGKLPTWFIPENKYKLFFDSWRRYGIRPIVSRLIISTEYLEIDRVSPSDVYTCHGTITGGNAQRSEGA